MVSRFGCCPQNQIIGGKFIITTAAGNNFTPPRMKAERFSVLTNLPEVLFLKIFRKFD